MKPWIGVVVLIIVVVGAAAWWLGRDESAPVARVVEVRRGEVLKYALATGKVGPEHEVYVKSRVSGFADEVFVRAGDRVPKGAPLVQMRPDTTPLSSIEAQRSVEMARLGEETASEYVEGKHLLSWLMRTLQGSRQLERMHQTAVLQRKRAEERLALLEKGRARVEEQEIDSIVRAPIDGTVLECLVHEGDPVVPVGAYQAATVLMTLADMDDLVFKGTIDEIDVGRVKEGLPAEIRLGALPDDPLAGRVEEIALKAKEVGNATLFDVRVAVSPREGMLIRAGYSAVAEIRIDRKENVLVIPERVIEFRNGKAHVRLMEQEGGIPVERPIELGLSDGLTVEVRAGLQEGDCVLEKQAPEIE